MTATRPFTRWTAGVLALAVVLLGMDPDHARTDDTTTPDALAFSMLLGGKGVSVVRAMAVDAAGNVYVTGGTSATDFPVTDGAFQAALGGDSSLWGRLRRGVGAEGEPDAFVVKLDSAGRIVWSTLVGGPSHDRAYAIDVDRQGYVYIAGRAGHGFPVTSGAIQTVHPNGPPAGPYPSQSGFVAKLTPDGKKLVFATYFGAGDDPSHPVRDMTVDDRGDIYVASSSSRDRYPDPIAPAFTRGFQPRPGGRRDLVAAKLTSDGGQVVWATYLGGSGVERSQPTIRVDGSGHVYLLTVTESTNAPTTPGAFGRAYKGAGDFYLAKLSPDGAKLVYGTYLGGSAREEIETHQLAVDGEGHAYVVASTNSRDFPTTAGAVQTTFRGAGRPAPGARTDFPGDVVVAKISPDGSRLVASTFLGGTLGEHAEGTAVDAQGNVYVTGGTYSDDFPTTEGAFQRKRAGRVNFFVVKLAADFRRLLYSSYLGGSGSDEGRAMAVDAAGNVYVGGQTSSTDWPLHPSSRTRRAGERDAAVAKFALGRR